MRILNIDPKRFREIWKLAFPIIMGTITVMIMNQTDRIMIGRWQENISGAALSASTQVQVFILLMALILGSSMTIALQSIASRRNGEGNLLNAGETFQTGVFISILLGIFATSFTLMFHEQIVLLLIGNTDPFMVELGTSYFFWRCFELFFVIIMFAYRGFFNGIGRPHADMYFTILRVGLNIILNFGFIYGYFGFPELGVEGAAIATLISTIVSFIAFTIFVFTSKARHEYQYLKRSNPLQFHKIWRIIRLSIPGSLQFAAMFGFMYFNRVIISKYGSDMGGASSIMFAISNIMFMFVMGLGIAGATLVGNSLGRGKPELAKQYSNDIAKMGVAIMFIFSMLVFIFPKLIMSIYTNNVDVISVGTLPLRIFISTQLFNAAGLIYSKCLQGAGAQKQITAFEYIAQAWQILATSLLAFVFDAPFWVLWIGFSSYQVLMSAMNYFYFRSNRWQNLKV